MTKKTKQFMVQYKYPRQVMPLHTRNLEPSPLPPRIRVFAVVLFPEKFTAIEKHHELQTCDGKVLRLWLHFHVVSAVMPPL